MVGAKEGRRAAKQGPSVAPLPAGALADDFFAGRYTKVVEATFDAGSDVPREHVAFVVGALTFLGRTEDAEICFQGARRGARAMDARSVAAARFFLGVAHARAGDPERARRYLTGDALARSRDEDPWIAAFAFQGLACVRYFAGRYRAAAHHSLRALRAAHAASFPYLQMFANDMRGHALAQLGEVRAGLVLLERARGTAERLEFTMNAHAIEVSIARYTAEIRAQPSVIQALTKLLARHAHDSYSRRGLLDALAVQHALHGQGTKALALLEESDVDARRQGAQRALLSTTIARLHVARFGRGPEACAELLEEARPLAASADAAIRAQLLGFEVWVSRAAGDVETAARALHELRAIARATSHARARSTLEQLEELPSPARPFAEDELTPLLRAVTWHDARVVDRLVAQGLTGPVPEALGLVPGERVILLEGQSVMVLERFGDLEVKRSPPRWCATLLRALAAGGAPGASKESLVAALWGLRRYVPSRHDPLLRTTIHRLRAFLGAFAHWIVVTESGYACRAPVHVVGDAVGRSVDEMAPLLEGELPHAVAPTRGPVAATEERDVTSRVLGALREVDGPLGVKALVRGTGLSTSTVQRALRALVAAKRVVRTGNARATRYRSRDVVLTRASTT